MIEYLINPCSSVRIDVKKEQTITVIDLEGGQVADFFAVSAENSGEFLSAGVTIDVNESLRLGVGSVIYTNLYRPMFEVVYDDVGEHDLIHPCCRTEMYDFFYKNGVGHPNCLDNINEALNIRRDEITAVNLFMYTKYPRRGRFPLKSRSRKRGTRLS